MLFLFPLSVVTIYRPCNHHIWLLKKRNCKFLKEFLHARFGMTEFCTRKGGIAFAISTFVDRLDYNFTATNKNFHIMCTQAYLFSFFFLSIQRLASQTLHKEPNKTIAPYVQR